MQSAIKQRSQSRTVLRARDAKHLRVKKSCRKRASKPKDCNILRGDTANKRTTYRNWKKNSGNQVDRDRRSERKSGMLHYLTKRSTTKPFHAHSGPAGIGILINKTWKDNVVRVNSINPRVAELVLFITKCYKLEIVHRQQNTQKNA